MIQPMESTAPVDEDSGGRRRRRRCVDEWGQARDCTYVDEVCNSNMTLYSRTSLKNNKIVMINKCCNPLFELIFNAGCTTNSDGSGLPVHRTRRDEIIRMIAATTDAVNTTINAVGLPAGICFARSSLDGYCPPDQVEFIQSNLLASLESLFMSHSAQITVDKKYWTVFLQKSLLFQTRNETKSVTGSSRNVGADCDALDTLIP